MKINWLIIIVTMLSAVMLKAAETVTTNVVKKVANGMPTTFTITAAPGFTNAAKFFYPEQPSHHISWQTTPPAPESGFWHQEQQRKAAAQNQTATSYQIQPAQGQSMSKYDPATGVTLLPAEARIPDRRTVGASQVSYDWQSGTTLVPATDWSYGGGGYGTYGYGRPAGTFGHRSGNGMFNVDVDAAIIVQPRPYYQPQWTFVPVMPGQQIIVNQKSFGNVSGGFGAGGLGSAEINTGVTMVPLR